MVGEAEAALPIPADEREVACAAELVALEVDQVPVRVGRRPRVAEHAGVDVRLEPARRDADELADSHRPPGARPADPDRPTPDVVDGGGEAELVPAADARDCDLARRALIEVGKQLGADGDAPHVDASAYAERARRPVGRVCGEVALADGDDLRHVGREDR